MTVTAHLGVLTTSRLLLRPSTVDDAAVFHELWTERDVRVPAHRRISPEGRPTVADIAERIRAEPAEAPLRLLSVVADQATVIGYCGLIPPDGPWPGEPGLAYELLRRAHGNGYATEAARAVVEWARSAGYVRLRAGVWDWNVASRRVLRKLGFHEVAQGAPHSAYGHTIMTVCDLAPAQTPRPPAGAQRPGADPRSGPGVPGLGRG